MSLGVFVLLQCASFTSRQSTVKMPKRKLTVKTLNEKCKALKEIEKGLSNKEASLKYGVPPNTISTWIKNKAKYFKALEDNCSSKKQKLRDSNFDLIKNLSLFSEKRGNQMQDLISKFESLLLQEKLEKCKQAVIPDFFKKQK